MTSESKLDVSLENLSPEEAEKINEYLLTLRQPEQNEQETKVPRKKRKRRKKKDRINSGNKVDKMSVNEYNRASGGIGRQKDRGTGTRQGTTTKRQSGRRNSVGGVGHGSCEGQPSSKQNIDNSEGRPNLFLQDNFIDGLHKKHKNDSEIDKKLSGGNKVTERDRVPDTIEINCVYCNQWFMASSSTIGDEGRYVCNKCSLNRG